nr:hypothetical protein [Leisingera sp. ANG-M1]
MPVGRGRFAVFPAEGAGEGAAGFEAAGDGDSWEYFGTTSMAAS